jgi:predicted Zn-dependent protease
MRMPAFRLILLLLTVVMAGGGTGCAMNPVSGTPDLVLMSEPSEVNIGSTNDAKIREKYSVHNKPELQAYVDRIGQKLAAQSHRPTLKYHFTVLDSPEVNAFALPGGYVYITRGILAYLNSEAELAAVLGHEIGHVTARHGVRQHSAATATGLVGAIIGVATGVRVSQDLFNVLGNAMLSGYGRDHELEADRLGAEYIARAGYDPQAMIRVIGVLKNQEEFEKKRAEAENRQPRIYHGVFASHPSSDRRLQEAVGQADKHKTLAEPKLARNEFLKMIEKLPFGEPKRTDSLLRDNHYYHKAISATLRFPEDWHVAASDYRITASSPDFQSVLQVDIEDLVKDMSPEVFLKTRMGVSSLERGGPLSGMKHPTYSGIVPTSPVWGDRKTRVSVVYLNDKRFLFSGATNTPERFTAADTVFSNTALSLHALSPQEKSMVERAMEGPRVRIVTARPNDTFAELAKRSPLKDNGELILRLINDKFPDGEPQVSELIKIIE